MCLLKYKFVILDGVFLVHPGIKRFTVAEDWRKTYIIQNNKTYNQIINNLKNKYPNSRRC